LALGIAVEAMPGGAVAPALEPVLGERARKLEQTQWGLLLLLLATLLSWIREVEVLGLAIGAIAVVLILLGASAFGPRHGLLVWTAVVVFVTAMIAFFGIVDSFAATIRNIPSGASGPATASQVLGALDTLLYGSLVVVSILSFCNALIAFELEDRPGRILLAAGVAAQIAVSVSLVVLVLMPLVHQAVERAFAVTPPDMSIISTAGAQVRSLRGLAVLNSIPSMIFAGAYAWAYHRISRVATSSPGTTPGRTSRALLAGIVGLILLVSAAEVGALVSGALPTTPRPPPTWRTVVSFSGNRTGMTPNFTINGTQFQFSESMIDYGPGSFSFSVTVYHAGTSTEIGRCGFGGGPGPATGGCGPFSAPGTYYIAVTDMTGVSSWTITVSELT
jgi:hypothetical protein